MVNGTLMGQYSLYQCLMMVAYKHRELLRLPLFEFHLELNNVSCGLSMSARCQCTNSCYLGNAQEGCLHTLLQ